MAMAAMTAVHPLKLIGFMTVRLSLRRLREKNIKEVRCVTSALSIHSSNNNVSV
jgi:hypothetical protein